MSARRFGRGRGEADRGSATVWSLGAMAVLCVVFGFVLALGQAVAARHRAAGGADLAALAAADHWSDGVAQACARADRVARAQGARVVRCAVVGEVSDVTAASGRGLFTAEMRARAGPPDTVAVPTPLPPQVHPDTEPPPTHQDPQAPSTPPAPSPPTPAPPLSPPSARELPAGVP
ncbi:Rv3654c family TadE-like protein [Streptomyces humidus]|uniref:Rv3654c family TadE-like protein n=1 Tax=Streptomyces humidus TaxID=52259 RepID=UPI0027E3F5B0|nr:Rv3654c family TadE-like protein [Streptomyces humidus]